MVLKDTRGQYAAVPSLKAACSRDGNFDNKPVQQQQHAAAYKTKACNGSGIPYPLLPSRQGHPSQSFEGNQSRLHAARLAYSKSASCSIGPDGKSTSTSPPLGNKDLLIRQGHSKSTTATTAKSTTTAPTAAHQRQGRAGLFLPPATAPIPLPPRFGCQIRPGKLELTKETSSRNGTLINGQQDSAAAPRRLRHSSTPDLSFTPGLSKESDSCLASSIGLAVAKDLPRAGAEAPPPTDGERTSAPDGAAVKVPTAEAQMDPGTSGARRLSSPPCEPKESGLASHSPLWTPKPEGTNGHHASAAPVAAPETNDFNSITVTGDAVGTNDGSVAPYNDTSSNSSCSRSDGNVLDIGDNDAVHFSIPEAFPIREADSML